MSRIRNYFSRLKFPTVATRLCVLSLLAPLSSFAITATPTSTVQEFHLNNGLTLLVKPNTAAPVAMLQVWYRVGSVDEKNGLTGISHALEHMMFEGSKNYPHDSFTQIIEHNGGAVNAMTTNDYTQYHEELAVDKLPIALKLEADRMANLTLNPKTFAKEIEVVKEEKRLRVDNNPMGLTYFYLMTQAFIENPYHHPTIGWTSDLNQMTDADLRVWYQQWYAPNNAVIVIVGDVNPQQVYQLVQQTFGNIRTKALPTLKMAADDNQPGIRQIQVKAPAKLPWIVIGYNVPSLVTAKEKWEPYALYVMSGILSSGDSARLNRTLINDQAIASEVGADYEPYSKLDTLFTLDATPTPPNTTTKLQEKLLQAIYQLQTQLVSPQELATVKTQISANKIYSQDSLTTQATNLGLSEILGLGWQNSESFLKNIQAVTPQQIQWVARKYFVPNRITIATLAPLPTTDNVAAPVSVDQFKSMH